MPDTDKQYINYNLSLVDPNNIDVETPIKVNLLKENASGDVVDKKDFDAVDAVLGTNFKKDNSVKIEIETPDEEKIEQDVSNYVLNEDKSADGGTLPIDWFAQLGLAREFPLEPIDGKFKTHVLRADGDPEEEGVWNGATGLIPDLINASRNKKMKDFEVTEDNQGKNEKVFENKYDKRNEIPIVRVLDQEYEKTKAKGATSKYLYPYVPVGEKDEDFSELQENNLGELIKTRILDQEYEKKKDRGASSKYKPYRFNNVSNGKDDTYVDIMNVTPFLTSSIAKAPYTKEELTYDDVVKKLNIKGQASNLGAMHVYPANPNDEGGILSKYEIPFEFNPKISEGGRGAKFEATSLLSRVGDIQSYIKTDSTSIQLTTRYQVLSVEPKTKDEIKKAGANLIGDHQGVGTWMESFHLRNVQSIEMAYRGLVFPQIANDGGSYFRPPLIKIVFGNSNKVKSGEEVGVTPFNNLLTYPYHFDGSTKIYHKSFIVTKVDIKKDWDNTPVILNEDNDGILDLQAFDVSLDLMEVDPMYIGVLPSFEDYYSIVKNVDKIGV